MNSKPPTLEEWRHLYDVVSKIKALSPWQWMEETDIFGVKNPETGEIGFVSTMGKMGEHYAIAVYRGNEGLYGFWELHDTSYYSSPEKILEVPQIQVSFENRKSLQKKDLETIKQLGIKFKGVNAWPMFRSFKPGKAPWYLESEEVRFLTCVLEQTLDVASRFKQNEDILMPGDDDDYLIREAQKQPNGTLKWKDAVVKITPPEPISIPIPMDYQSLAALKGLPQNQMTLELDFFLLAVPVKEKEERPYYPYLMLMVDEKSGLILDSEMLVPEVDIETMWGLIPVTFVYMLLNLKLVPSTVCVRNPLLFDLLEPLSEDLE
ncbi:MAG: hypothetical protein D6813_15955, partial [Calditrichaeota bacterium]